MISKKAKYALKALKVLTEEHGKGPVLISHIAERENIPKKFLEAILLELRNHGILSSQKGKGGGYMPVSYTHLDVYKRQVQGMWVTIGSDEKICLAVE